MGLRRGGAIVALLVILAGAAWSAQANFAAADGFSGRNGVDCTSCHATPHPTAPPATAHLEGLPEAWEPGATYTLTLRVEGGPTALPAPAPQGGFELEADRGTFRPAEGFGDLMRSPHPNEITYLPAGTLMREWRVTWTAPDLSREPTDARFWLAVLSANGNHVVATNTSDSGEKFDNTATLTAAVPPSPDALRTWRETPLLPPTTQVHDPGADGAWTVTGRHTDANATHLAWRVGDGGWRTRPTDAAWVLRLDALLPGTALEVRSEGAGRTSPAVAAAVGTSNGIGDPTDAPGHTTPGPGLLLLLAPLLAAARTATRHRP